MPKALPASLAGLPSLARALSLRFRHSFLALILGGGLLAGCQEPFHRTGPRFIADTGPLGSVTHVIPETVTESEPSPRIEPSSPPFTIGPGDKLEIELLSDPSAHSTVTVGPDGKIYFYLLPGLDVWGLTLAETRAALSQELAKYLAAPGVSVSLRAVESKRVWLLGQIHNAGVYPMGAPTTLLEAISAAGGLQMPTAPGTSALDDLADLRRSFVIREGQRLPVDFYRLIKEGDTSQNVLLRPDDFVYVPPGVSRDVYVLGAVRNARPVAWTEGTTLVSTLAAAGGTIKDAYLTHVGIVRGSLSQPRIAIVNYKDIVAGKARDVLLEPRDILYVPFTPYRTVARYLNLILDTFARAVAINEGARAVSRDVSPVGVQIGIGVR